MKRLATVALIVAWAAFAAQAQQRPVARGGSSTHNAPAPRGGFSGSAPRAGGYHGPAAARGGIRPSAPTRFGGTRPPAPGGFRNPNRPLAPGRAGFRNGQEGDRRAGNGGSGSDFRGHHRMPYRPEHREDYPYGVTGSIGWVSPYVLGYPDSMDQGEAQGSADNAGEGGGEGNGAEPGNQGQVEPLPPWPSSEPAQQLAARTPAQEPRNEEAVTLVFKDGRPSEQIHNYLLTGKTLYVQDQQRRDIPLEQLDLIATAKVNHDSGVDFRLPDSNK